MKMFNEHVYTFYRYRAWRSMQLGFQSSAPSAYKRAEDERKAQDSFMGIAWEAA